MAQVKRKGKQGKSFKEKKPKKEKRFQDAALPDAGGSDDDGLVVSDEDVEFVRKMGSNRVAFLSKLNTEALDRSIREQQQKSMLGPQKPKELEKKAVEASGPAEKGDGDEDGEERYERLPRKLAEARRAGGQPAVLPVKTPDGELVFAKLDAPLKHQKVVVNVEGISVEDMQEEDLKAGAKEKAEGKGKKEKKKDKLKDKARASVAGAEDFQQEERGKRAENAEVRYISPVERRAAARVNMAAAATQVMADPEGARSELKTLLRLVEDPDPLICRPAMLTLMAVFRDILPGYRIRLPTEKELATKVSKEVAAQQQFETALLTTYQAYLKALLAATSGAASHAPDALPTTRIAVRCMASLLISHPTFNYTSDILQAITPHAASSDPQVRGHVVSAVSALVLGELRGDAGASACEAVELVADLVRRKACVMPPDAITALLGLKFTHVELHSTGAAGSKTKISRKKKKKAKDEVDKAFEEAEVAVNAARIAERQTRTLTALFEIFFRVLKTTAVAIQPADVVTSGQEKEATSPQIPRWSRARLLRRCPLLFAALEGLGRYAHFISVEYFNDMLLVLREILASPVLPLLERLRCLLTVGEIMRGQGEALNIERTSVFTALYATLLELPSHPGLWQEDKGGMDNLEDEEEDLAAIAGSSDVLMLSSMEARPAGSVADAASVASSTGGSASRSSAGSLLQSSEGFASLLAKVLSVLLLEPKALDVGTLAAIVKRMLSTALHCETCTALVLLGASFRTIRRQPRLTSLLEWEGEAPVVGGRRHDPNLQDPSLAGGLSATCWEASFLAARHYHPHLAQAATSLLALAPGADHSRSLAGPLGMSGGLTDLAAAYDTARGAFRPAPPPPQRRPPGQERKRRFPSALSSWFESEALSAVGPQWRCEDAEASNEEAATLMQHVRVLRQHARNASLRAEDRRLAAQLTSFRKHLEDAGSHGKM